MEDLKELSKLVKEKGLNIYMMLNLYKKRSKLREPIPDGVVRAVCLDYLKKKGQIDNSFPYFLKVLRAKTEDYFARENIRQHEKIKNQPSKLKIKIEI